MMSKFFLVITTIPTQEDAEALSSEVIARGLAACAQIHAPCQSIYSWKGQVEKAVEYPVHFKTNDMKHGALRDFIAEKHTYDVPEILSIQIDAVNESYATWVNQNLDN